MLWWRSHLACGPVSLAAHRRQRLDEPRQSPSLPQTCREMSTYAHAGYCEYIRARQLPLAASHHDDGCEQRAKQGHICRCRDIRDCRNR